MLTRNPHPHIPAVASLLSRPCYHVLSSRPCRHVPAFTSLLSRPCRCIRPCRHVPLSCPCRHVPLTRPFYHVPTVMSLLSRPFVTSLLSRPNNHVHSVTSLLSRPCRHVPAFTPVVTSLPSCPFHHVPIVTSPSSHPCHHVPSITYLSSRPCCHVPRGSCLSRNVPRVTSFHHVLDSGPSLHVHRVTCLPHAMSLTSHPPTHVHINSSLASRPHHDTSLPIGVPGQGLSWGRWPRRGRRRGGCPTPPRAPAAPCSAQTPPAHRRMLFPSRLRNSAMMRTRWVTKECGVTGATGSRGK